MFSVFLLRSAQILFGGSQQKLKQNKPSIGFATNTNITTAMPKLAKELHFIRRSNGTCIFYLVCSNLRSSKIYSRQ